MKPITFNAPRAVACGLGVLIAVQLFALERSWQTLRTHGGTPAGPRMSRPNMSHARLAKAIIDSHLFGAAPSPRDDPANPPVTTTYSLKGIIALGLSGQGFAIIGSSDGKSKLYQTGQPLSPQIVLRQVAFDYVLLLNDEKLERLALPRGALAARLTAGAGPAVPASAEATTALTADTRATLQAFGLNVIEDGAGGITGLTGQGSPSWHHSGLLPSDVIVAIDGTPVGDVLKTPMAIDNASVAAVTTLTVLRDGVQMDLEASPEPAQAPRRLRHRS
jgi:type II secretory pathway component PulC